MITKLNVPLVANVNAYHVELDSTLPVKGSYSKQAAPFISVTTDPAPVTSGTVKLFLSHNTTAVGQSPSGAGTGK